jgi:hypothetical protein
MHYSIWNMFLLLFNVGIQRIFSKIYLKIFHK